MFARWRAAGLVLPAVMTLFALPVLIGLGTWQLQRKVWKEDLIAKANDRPKAAPITYSDALNRAKADLGEAEYLHVSVEGRFDHNQERHVYAPLTKGSGWHVYTPLHPGNGLPAVFVNRGWVPDALKDASAQRQTGPDEVVTVTGLLRGPSLRSWYTPENNLIENRWYSRDLPGMLESLPEHTPSRDAPHGFAPFFIDADAQAASVGEWPKGGVTEIRLNNPHLQYVVTWYGLALTLIVIFTLFARQKLAALDKPRDGTGQD